MADEIDQRLARLATQPFRARFVLRGPDRVTAESRAASTLRQHARDTIRQRLAPSSPRNDGKQTPYRGHPVFVAQDYVVEVITRWIEQQVATG